MHSFSKRLDEHQTSQWELPTASSKAVPKTTSSWLLSRFLHNVTNISSTCADEAASIQLTLIDNLNEISYVYRPWALLLFMDVIVKKSLTRFTYCREQPSHEFVLEWIIQQNLASYMSTIVVSSENVLPVPKVTGIVPETWLFWMFLPAQHDTHSLCGHWKSPKVATLI